MNSAAPTVTIEYVEPLEAPEDYGGGQLATELQNVEQIEGAGPSLSPDLLDALHGADYATAESMLPDIRDWYSDKHDRYTVLDSGTVTAAVPILVVSAPDVPDIEVTAAQTSTRASGGEVSFKVGGMGLGLSAKLTVSDKIEVSSGPGEIVVASLSLPVVWELRAKPNNEDYNWIHTQIGRSTETASSLRIATAKSMIDAQVLHVVSVNNLEGGKKPFGLSNSVALEAGADFTFGLKLDALGIDTSLKVAAEDSTTIDLSAKLPSGHNYQAAWLSGPWGARVSTTA